MWYLQKIRNCYSRKVAVDEEMDECVMIDGTC